MWNKIKYSCFYALFEFMSGPGTTGDRIPLLQGKLKILKGCPARSSQWGLLDSKKSMKKPTDKG